MVGTCSGIGANIEQWDRKDRTPYSVFCPVGNVATRHPLSAEGATVTLAGHSVLFARRDTPVFQEIDAKAGSCIPIRIIYQPIMMRATDVETLMSEKRDTKTC